MSGLLYFICMYFPMCVFCEEMFKMSAYWKILDIVLVLGCGCGCGALAFYAKQRRKSSCAQQTAQQISFISRIENWQFSKISGSFFKKHITSIDARIEDVQSNIGLTDVKTSVNSDSKEICFEETSTADRMEQSENTFSLLNLEISDFVYFFLRFFNRIRLSYFYKQRTKAQTSSEISNSAGVSCISEFNLQNNEIFFTSESNQVLNDFSEVKRIPQDSNTANIYRSLRIVQDCVKLNTEAITALAAVQRELFVYHMAEENLPLPATDKKGSGEEEEEEEEEESKESSSTHSTDLNTETTSSASDVIEIGTGQKPEEKSKGKEFKENNSTPAESLATITQKFFASEKPKESVSASEPTAMRGLVSENVRVTVRFPHSPERHARNSQAIQKLRPLLLKTAQATPPSNYVNIPLPKKVMLYANPSFLEVTGSSSDWETDLSETELKFTEEDAGLLSEENLTVTESGEYSIAETETEGYVNIPPYRGQGSTTRQIITIPEAEAMYMAQQFRNIFESTKSGKSQETTAKSKTEKDSTFLKTKKRSVSIGDTYVSVGPTFEDIFAALEAEDFSTVSSIHQARADTASQFEEITKHFFSTITKEQSVCFQKYQEIRAFIKAEEAIRSSPDIEKREEFRFSERQNLFPSSQIGAPLFFTPITREQSVCLPERAESFPVRRPEEEEEEVVSEAKPRSSFMLVHSKFEDISKSFRVGSISADPTTDPLFFAPISREPIFAPPRFKKPTTTRFVKKMKASAAMKLRAIPAKPTTLSEKYKHVSTSTEPLMTEDITPTTSKEKPDKQFGHIETEESKAASKLETIQGEESSVDVKTKETCRLESSVLPIGQVICTHLQSEDPGLVSQSKIVVKTSESHRDSADSGIVDISMLLEDKEVSIATQAQGVAIAEQEESSLVARGAEISTVEETKLSPTSTSCEIVTDIKVDSSASKAETESEPTERLQFSTISIVSKALISSVGEESSTTMKIEKISAISTSEETPLSPSISPISERSLRTQKTELDETTSIVPLVSSSTEPQRDTRESKERQTLDVLKREKSTALKPSSSVEKPFSFGEVFSSEPKSKESSSIEQPDPVDTDSSSAATEPAHPDDNISATSGLVSFPESISSSSEKPIEVSSSPEASTLRSVHEGQSQSSSTSSGDLESA